MKVEIAEGEGEKIVVEELLWMHDSGCLTKKQKKAYRTVLKDHMTVDDYKMLFHKGEREVYK